MTSRGSPGEDKVCFVTLGKPWPPYSQLFAPQTSAMAAQPSVLSAHCSPQAEGKSCLFSQLLPSPVEPH